MQAVILVGGQGTRLRPLTLTTPKPLVPLCNRPVIEHIVRWLAQYGIDDIILATQYRAAAFEDWLRRFHRALPAVRVRAHEEPEPRGTAGAVAHVAAQLHGPAVIVNGDNILDLDLHAMQRAHQAAQAAVTIATDAVSDVTGRGVVVAAADGRVGAFQEKPAPGTAHANTVNTGVYLLEPEAIAAIPRARFCSFEQDIFPQLIAEHAAVYAFQQAHTWIDTGTPSGYFKAQAAVLEGIGSTPAGICADGVWREDNITLDSGAVVQPPVAVGFGTMIAAGSRLIRSSIGRDCHLLVEAQIDTSAIWNQCQIERGAVIRSSIVGHNCYIGAGARLEQALLGDGCIIQAAAQLPPGTVVAPNTIWPEPNTR